MGKLLFWLIVVGGGLLAARLLARSLARQAAAKSGRSPRTSGRPKNQGASENLVRCSHCGIHLPRSQAYLLHGQIWCSEDHARAGD